MAEEKNKVKFGLKNVHWAKIKSFDAEGMPEYSTPIRLSGAVSMALNAEGGAENFYADNGVYYVINNNSGYSGDLEVALITAEFAAEILGEIIDSNGVQIETVNAEFQQFALLFEFDGDKKHIRHCLYCCSASRPSMEGQTTESNKEVKTEKLSLTASAIENGLVKAKSCEQTNSTIYKNWYKTVYMPDFTEDDINNSEQTI